jgi:hypothetical protein
MCGRRRNQEGNCRKRKGDNPQTIRLFEYSKVIGEVRCQFLQKKRQFTINSQNPECNVEFAPVPACLIQGNAVSTGYTSMLKEAATENDERNPFGVSNVLQQAFSGYSQMRTL